MALLWFSFALILVLIGILGTLLPGLPGLPLVALGLGLAAWADGFQHVGGWSIFWIACIGLAAVLIDLALSVLGPKMTGASRWAVIGATVGAIGGLFMGLVGVLIGPFVGALIGEYMFRQNLGQATRAGLGAWLGLIVGAAVKVAALMSMLGIFALSWFFNP